MISSVTLPSVTKVKVVKVGLFHVLIESTVSGKIGKKHSDGAFSIIPHVLSGIYCAPVSIKLEFISIDTQKVKSVHYMIVTVQMT